MSNALKLYTINFVDDRNDDKINWSVINFMNKIEETLKSDPIKVIRKINERIMRVHAFEWNINKDIVVVPFGKLKITNKPFTNDPKTNKLLDIPEDMYDVNHFAYHSKYRVLMLTGNKDGPRENHIEEYLNSFLDPNSSFKIKLNPIKRNFGLDQLRNAKLARSITISLNISKPTDRFLKNDITNDNGITANLKNMMNISKKTINSNSIKLELGLGSQRNSSLNIESLVELIDSLNLDEECIKEISVNLINKTSEKYDLAKLRKNEIIISLSFPINDEQLGTEYILNNIEDVLVESRNKYYKHVEEYFKGSIDRGEDYEFIENFKQPDVPKN